MSGQPGDQASPRILPRVASRGCSRRVLGPVSGRSPASPRTSWEVYGVVPALLGLSFVCFSVWKLPCPSLSLTVSLRPGLAGFFIFHCPCGILPQTERSPVFPVARFPESADRLPIRAQEGLRWEQGRAAGPRAPPPAAPPSDSRRACCASFTVARLWARRACFPWSSPASPRTKPLFLVPLILATKG